MGYFGAVRPVASPLPRYEENPMLVSLITLAALAQPVPDAPSGAAPEQVVASIDARGKLTIYRVSSNGSGAMSYEVPLRPAKRDEDRPPPNIDKGAKAR